MSAADDLKSVLDSSGVDLGGLPTSFGLADFDYMLTSQRTMAQVYNKLKQVQKHGNYWVDLRVLGLAEDDKLSELGKKALSEFSHLTGEVRRLHFILKNIRSDGGAPAQARKELEKRTRNLEEFVARLPKDGSGGICWMSRGIFGFWRCSTSFQTLSRASSNFRLAVSGQ